jgi:stage II sporulation protein M
MSKALKELILDEGVFKTWLTYVPLFSATFIAESLLYGKVPMGFLDEMLRKLKGSLPNTFNPLLLFIIIFLHNLLVATITLVFSATFIVPALVVAVNGLIVGYVISLNYSKLGLAGSIVGLIPHGGIEIPAITLAAATGIVIRKGIRNYVKQTSVAMLAVVLMLAIAAVTEAVITPSLVLLTLKVLG